MKGSNQVDVMPLLTGRHIRIEHLDDIPKVGAFWRREVERLHVENGLKGCCEKDDVLRRSGLTPKRNRLGITHDIGRFDVRI